MPFKAPENKSGTYETSYTTVILASKLAAENNGESIIHPVGRINGYFWWLYLYYNGDIPQNKGNLCVNLYWEDSVNMTVSATFSIKDKTLPFKFRYRKTKFHGCIIISHEELKAVADNDKITITINASFTEPGPCFDMEAFKPLPGTNILAHELISSSRHITHDFTFVVENGKEKREIKAHRAYLSIISPVFEAMFSNKTKEAATGQIDIVDFDYETVKDALDLCYGYTFEYKTTNETLEVLRFADKYEINGITNNLNKFISENISVYNFFNVLSYARMYDLQDLQEKCASFFAQNEAKIRENEIEFDKLDDEVLKLLTPKPVQESSA